MKHTMCIATLLALAGHLAGCSRSLNSAIGSLDGPALPALDPDTPSLTADQPSVTDLDRRGWPVVIVAVPIRQVEHNPAWIRTRIWTLPDLQSGAYPTAITALHAAHDPSAVAVEAAVELVALPAGYVIHAARSSSADGLIAVKRSPRPDESFDRRPAEQPEYAGRWIAETP